MKNHLEFREKLRRFPPFSNDRVDNPWQSFLDIEEINKEAFQMLELKIQELIDGEPRQSKGVLLVGPAGSGKTHLLMRVVKHLSNDYHVMFVRRLNTVNIMNQDIWTAVIDTLCNPLPGENIQGKTQMDVFLTHVFLRMLLVGTEALIQQNQKYAQQLEINRKSLIELEETLGKAEALLKMDKYKNALYTTIQNLLIHWHPGIDTSIVTAFFKFYYCKNDACRREIRQWLVGQVEDAEKLGMLGLPSWIPLDAEIEGYEDLKEKKAENALHTLNIMSKYYKNPMILCFDQLEGLRGQQELIQKYTDTVREISTRCDNFLIITCIFPDMWEELSKYSDQSYIDRAGQTKVILEQLTPEKARLVLEARLSASFQKAGIPQPDSLYPFEEEDIPHLLYKKQPAGSIETVSIRHFIARSGEAWNYWILGKIPAELDHSRAPVKGGVAQPRLNSIVENDELLQYLKIKFEQCLKDEKAKNEDPNEEVTFSKITSIIDTLITHQKTSIERYRFKNLKKAFPQYFLLRRGTSLPVSVAILNGTGNHFTSRMRNYLAERTSGTISKSLLIRDRRVGDFPTSPGAAKLLENFMAGNITILMDGEEIARLNAIHSMVEDVRNQDYQIKNDIITLNSLVDWLLQDRLLDEIRVFKEISNTDIGRALLSPGNEDQVQKQHGGCIENDEGKTNPTDAATTDGGRVDVPNPSNLPGGRNPLVDDTAEIFDYPKRAQETPDGPQQDNETSPEEAPAVEPVPATEMVDDKHPDIVLASNKEAPARAGHIGRLVASNQRVVLSLEEPVAMMLTGYMGSGKSYALGTIIENAALSPPSTIQNQRPLAVVAFNYRQAYNVPFEYSTYALPNDKDVDVEALERNYSLQPAGISPVNIVTYGEELERHLQDYGDNPVYRLSFLPSELDVESWTLLLKPPNERADYVQIIINILKELNASHRLTLADIRETITQTTLLTPSQKRFADVRLYFASNYIREEREFKWQELMSRGSLTVFDLRSQMVQKEDAITLIMVISNIIRSYLNINKLLVYDEAHEYIKSPRLREYLNLMISQMRHYGLSVVVATQFPENIQDDLFRNFNIRFIFQTPFLRSYDYLRRRISRLGSITAQDIANLASARGECYIVNDHSLNTNPDIRRTQLFQFRPRLSKHGGQTRTNLENQEQQNTPRVLNEIPRDYVEDPLYPRWNEFKNDYTAHLNSILHGIENVEERITILEKVSLEDELEQLKDMKKAFTRFRDTPLTPESVLQVQYDINQANEHGDRLLQLQARCNDVIRQGILNNDTDGQDGSLLEIFNAQERSAEIARMSITVFSQGTTRFEPLIPEPLPGIGKLYVAGENRHLVVSGTYNPDDFLETARQYGATPEVLSLQS